MKRAILTSIAALLILGACRSGGDRPDTRPSAAQGAVRAGETTTSSSTTTTATAPGMPPVRMAAAGTADCPPNATPDGLGGSAGPYALRMVSATKGFAVSDTKVLGTDDGRTWTVRYSGGDPFYAVDAPDADHAFAVGRQVALATTDGGRSWHPMDQPAAGNLTEVHFVDPDHGWGIAGNHVVRTGDGGSTWKTIDPPCGGEATCFTAPGDGWAAVGTEVYRSTDGGDTWQPAFTAPTAGIDEPFNADSVHIRQIDCAGTGAVWVTFAGAGSGGHISYVVYRGTAGGSWTPVMREGTVGPTSAPAGGTYPAPMTAIDPENAVLATYSPLAPAPDNLGLRFASDSGRSLRPARPVAGLFSATSLSFVSPDVGWIIGARSGDSAVNVILATSDGGRTWQEQYSYTYPRPVG